jgi:uncharacterized protein (TIGR02118 family)
MVKISILYPNDKNARFDLDYYVRKHMPLAIKLLGAHTGYRSVSVERGIDGAFQGADAPYVAVCHFQFDSPEDLNAALAAEGPILQGDIPNYTDITPIFQVGEVLISA